MAATTSTPRSRFGTVHFENGNYIRASGSSDWTVHPIPGFGLPIGPPLGMVQVVLDPPIPGPYTALVSAIRLPTTPMLCVNLGEQAADGFVVHIFEPVSTHTLQNGGFSFLVIPDEAATP
jgi:hypothetical protein